MAFLSGCNPQVCSPGEGYDASIHPASLLTAFNIAAVCALVLVAGVVVLAVVYRRDERPAWKRVTPLVIFAVGIAATLVALRA
jgi:4-hydroxybenzoate polyprenyltransferase